MKVTIKDIAEMAGVSISTVSRVINDSKPVNEDVRKRVLEAMKQTNYRANTLLTTIVHNDSSLIGVIIPEFSNTVLTELVEGMNKIAKLYGYDVVISLTDGTLENELHYLQQFRSLSVNGVIFVGSQLDEKHLTILKEADIPCVAAGQISDIPSIPSVHVDNITASYEAVKYLIQKGHRKIAMMKGPGDMAVGGHRFKGYQQALMDASLLLQKEWVVESGISLEDGITAMKQIAESSSMPTAVFCATDSMAIGAMNYLIDHGYRIPEDVSVFGFDGSLMSRMVRPKLSTVDYSAMEMGMTATRSLIKLIKGERVNPQHYNVTHHLAIRESTK